MEKEVGSGRRQGGKGRVRWREGGKEIAERQALYGGRVNERARGQGWKGREGRGGGN